VVRENTASAQPKEAPAMNLVESLLHALKDHGARQIFGIPGDFALPYFRIIEQSKILPLYTLSHEPAVGFAADAASRAHQGLGVAAVTYGAGALNMVNAVAAAYAEKSPLVVLSGGPGKGESRSGLLLHHQAKTLDSQFQMFREITCDQVRLDDAARAPADIARVLASALRNSEPVYIEIPRDMVNQPCAPVVREAPRREIDADALAACVDEILARLAQAASPVLMAGVEVRRFALEDKVASLSRRLGLPVVTSFMGRGLLAEQDAPLVGTYMGVAGLPEITRLVEDSDALFLLGEIVCDTNFAVSESGSTCARPYRRWTARVTLGYHVYPQLPLAALVDALLARVGEGEEPFAVTRPVYPHGMHGGRRDDRADRHRHGGERPDGRPRQAADRRRHGRLPVHRHGHRTYRAGRARLLRHHGLRRAGRPRLAGRDRAAAADPGRRRRLPDDRLGARQLPALRLGPDRAAVQQRQLGNAAHLPARVGFQRPQRLGLCGDGGGYGRRRSARQHPRRAEGRSGQGRWRRAAAFS
jgi:hypothetical protein